MSCGQGKYFEKRIKVKLLQEFANKKNKELGYYDENYYDDWTKEEEENKLKKLKEKEELKMKDLKKKLENEEMMTGPINIGFKNSHKIESVNKEQINSIIRNDNSENKKKLYEMNKEVNDAMFDKVYKDHVKEFFDPLIYKSKDSEMKDNYKFDDEMDKCCNNMNMDHHFMKNPLKKYTEAYLKYKNTMRTYNKTTKTNK